MERNGPGIYEHRRHRHRPGRGVSLVSLVCIALQIRAGIDRYRVLIDARKEITFPTTSVVTRRKTIREDRDTVMRFVRSHVEAIAFHKQNKEFSLKVLTKYVRTTDAEFLEGSYNIFKQDFIAAPYPITKGLEPTYDYVAQTRPDIRTHKPEEFVDPSFISELDKSGFIKKLYERK